MPKLVKICPGCQQEKPLAAFNKDRGEACGHRSRCRECCRTYLRQYRQANPGVHLESARQWKRRNRDYAVAQRRVWGQANKQRVADLKRSSWLRKKFGITVEDYDQLLAAQGGRCALCKELPAKGKRLAVDHDHETGNVRGLLCGRCNTALGALGDSVEGLQAALTYLEKSLCLNC